MVAPITKKNTVAYREEITPSEHVLLGALRRSILQVCFTGFSGFVVLLIVLVLLIVRLTFFYSGGADVGTCCNMYAWHSLSVLQHTLQLVTAEATASPNPLTLLTQRLR